MNSRISWGVIGLLICVFAFYMGSVTAQIRMIRHGEIRAETHVLTDSVRETREGKGEADDLQRAEQSEHVPAEGQPSEI